ncbi:hypothetical protein CUZ56_00592 [Saezia sanguinis]|uniref:Fido domain-containing protein n=1 Tax=Saezia sanguinis TaxID=1965230 RepID=A0A433SH78_9BURK|nr:type II toxin-antitoxin system death-on-curing family toxin [Saezia sanguinis]RUS68107.1 hypothetical protein CUZ56_00592 [Saezia sanguinis]
MSIQFVEAHEVIRFHDWILENAKGLTGIADTGRIEAMIMRVQNLYHYENITDVFELAAAYFLAIARGHCFADANKRTALITTAIFLDRNGFQLPESMTLVDQTVSVAAGKYSREDLASYLKQIVTLK